MSGKKRIKWVELVVGLHPTDWFITFCREGGKLQHYKVSWVFAVMLAKLVRKLVLKQLMVVVPTGVGWIAYPKNNPNGGVKDERN